MENNNLVKVENLRKIFPLTTKLFSEAKQKIHAVDDISFNIANQESLALVGESGSGKTTTGKLLVRLIDPTSGHIHINTEGKSVDVGLLKRKELMHFRRYVQMIFQDPYESLNPRRTIFDIVVEPLIVQKIFDIKEREDRVEQMLTMVGLSPASTFMFRFPHELSGGQRQRVAIARALVINPIFVVADEPTSMLDVSVRSTIMDLMQELSDELGLTYLYITHDLAVARYMTKKMAVLYTGKIVEFGETEEVIQHPLHPYTKALISAVPVPDPTFKRQDPSIIGNIAEPINPKPTCRFLDRCPIAQDICRKEVHPPLVDKGNNQYVACYMVK